MMSINLNVVDQSEHCQIILVTLSGSVAENLVIINFNTKILFLHLNKCIEVIFFVFS